MPIYKLPIGIRIPRHDECPKGNNIKQIEINRNSAKIVQGYYISDVTGEKFSSFAEINIDCDRLWVLFISLVRNLIPKEAYGVFARKDEKPILSNFTQRETIIEFYNKFCFELVNDGFLEFGVAHYDDKMLNEIFVSSFKYIKVWAIDKTKFRKIMNEFGLPEIKDLNFIDQFPVISEALSAKKIPGIKYYTEIYEAVKNFFASTYHNT